MPTDHDISLEKDGNRAGGLIPSPYAGRCGKREAPPWLHSAIIPSLDLGPCILSWGGGGAPLAGEIPEAGRKLMEAFWPGPLTMIFPKSEKRVSTAQPAVRDTVAIQGAD